RSLLRCRGDAGRVAGGGSGRRGRRAGRRDLCARAARRDQDGRRSRRPSGARIVELPEGRVVPAMAGVPQPARGDQVGGAPVTAETSQTLTTGGAQLERLRVLLVDDNASVLRFLAATFSANHCQVTTA